MYSGTLCLRFIKLGTSALVLWVGLGGCSGSEDPIVVPNPADTPLVIEFTKHSDNPLMKGGFSGGSFDVAGVRHASVLYDPGQNVYQMWYTGLDNSGRARIGYAKSVDGFAWMPQSQTPVIDVGSSGSFDDWHAYFPTVIKDGDIYKMWYTGDAYGIHYLGYATSADGIDWAKYSGQGYGGSVLDWRAKGWDRYTQATTVIKDGDVYKMWFGELGADGGIGYATSDDGIEWTIVGKVLSIGASDTFEEWRIHWPSVAKSGSKYVMLYAGQDNDELRRFGLATSSDSIIWTKHPDNPVLPLGAPGDMDDVSHYYPHIVIEADVVKLWYIGYGTSSAMGYAESALPDLR